MTGGFVLYKRNGFEIRVVEDSPTNEHVELWIRDERVAIIDTLGILKSGELSPESYVELKILPVDWSDIIDDDSGISCLYEV